MKHINGFRTGFYRVVSRLKNTELNIAEALHEMRSDERCQSYASFCLLVSWCKASFVIIDAGVVEKLYHSSNCKEIGFYLLIHGRP